MIWTWGIVISLLVAVLVAIVVYFLIKNDEKRVKEMVLKPGDIVSGYYSRTTFKWCYR